jgi:hypothetical protein
LAQYTSDWIIEIEDLTEAAKSETLQDKYTDWSQQLGFVSEYLEAGDVEGAVNELGTLIGSEE